MSTFVLPTRCADVTFEMGDGSYERNLGWWEGGKVGSLVWNPKGGEGHVLVKEVMCGEPVGTGPHPERPAACSGCGYCDGWGLGPSTGTTVCECGEDDRSRDHHYRLLRRAA